MRLISMTENENQFQKSDEAINWRNVGVKRERNHEGLIARLITGKTSIFQYNKDLMVFAAMVGFSEGQRTEVKGDVIEIILDTYASDGKDGFIYLLALLETKDGACLKDSGLRSSVKIFEEYCNAGLYIIAKWLDENPGDPTGIDTLLEKIFAKLSQIDPSKDGDNEDIDIDI